MGEWHVHSAFGRRHGAVGIAQIHSLAVEPVAPAHARLRLGLYEKATHRQASVQDRSSIGGGSIGGSIGGGGGSIGGGGGGGGGAGGKS